MIVFLSCVCIVLAAVVWQLLKEVRSINLRLKDVNTHITRVNGEMTLLDKRVVMLEDSAAASDIHAAV